MSHTYPQTSCIAFSAQRRARLIPARTTGRAVGLLLGIARNEKVKILAIGGVRDHLHISSLAPKINLSKVICDLKANSSKWMNESGIPFAWQEGYGAFSVSPSALRGTTLYPQPSRTS